MKKIISVVLFLCSLQVAIASAGDCTVEVSGFERRVGKCTIYLFKDKKGFPTDFNFAVTSVSAPVSNGKCLLVLKNIPQGKYAIVAHHDENGNGKMDKNLIGMPKEGVGTSNNAKAKFGPPSYEESMIAIANSSQTITITLKYL